MKKKKEKKYIAPNECSLRRWIGVLIVGLLLGGVLSGPFSYVAVNVSGSFMGISYYSLFATAAFAGLFWGMVIAIKVVGKTSLKDFVLGVGGRLNVKECLTVLGLYAAGFTTLYVLSGKYVSLRGVNPGEFLVLVVLMLLLAWMQTSWEELIFRGIFVRWACKNELGFHKKTIIVGFAAAVLFALSHATNPEVTTQSGFRVILALANYAIPAMMWHIANMYFGNLMPGMLIHWFNNFMLFTVISAEVTAMPFPTLLVDNTPGTPEFTLLCYVVGYAPLAVYMIVKARADKKAKAEN